MMIPLCFGLGTDANSFAIPIVPARTDRSNNAKREETTYRLLPFSHYRLNKMDKI